MVGWRKVEDARRTDKALQIFQRVTRFFFVRAADFDGLHQRHQRIIAVTAERADFFLIFRFIILFIFFQHSFLRMVLRQRIHD